MNNYLRLLEQELAKRRQILMNSEIAKLKLLKKLDIDKVDSQEGDDFADHFAALWKEIITTTKQVQALEQAVYYAKQAIAPN